MPSSSTCPRCNSARLVAGNAREPIAFVANSASFGSLRLGVEASSWLHACADCGLLFGEISPTDLSAHLERFPDAHVKRWLAEKPNKPL